jgi:hypothetical protein
MFADLILAAAILFFQPPPETETDRLAAHILRVYPRCTYAYTLADAIMTEARKRGLDPAYMAAIAWTESGYRNWVKGATHEVGLWQMIPAVWHATAWHWIRGKERPWWKLSKKQRHARLRDPVTSTKLAGWLIAYHMARCGVHTWRCYARYNSGQAWVHPRYVRRIRRRSAAVRARLRGW